MVTVLHVHGAEGHVRGGADQNNNEPILTNLSNTVGLLSRRNHYPRDGDWTFYGNIDAAGEEYAASGIRRDGLNFPYLVSANAYVSWSMEFDRLTPSQNSNIGVIVQDAAPYFNNYLLRISAGGSWELRSPSAAVRTMTIAQLGLKVGARHWFLLHFGTGRIRMWVGEDNPSAPGTLLEPAKWNVDVPVLDYSDPTQTGTFGCIKIGPGRVAFQVPVVGVDWDSVAYCDDSEMPDRPILCTILENTGDGLYSGALTGWDNEDGSTATYDRIDDTIMGKHDGSLGYIKTVPGFDRTDLYSALHAPAGAKIGPEDTILGLQPVSAISFAVPGSNSNCESGLTTHGPRHRGEVTSAGPNKWSSDAGIIGNNIWGAAWNMWPLDFDDNPWTIESVDDAEWMCRFENSPSTDDVWACTWGGIYVAYQRALPVPVEERSTAQAQVV